MEEVVLKRIKIIVSSTISEECSKEIKKSINEKIVDFILINEKNMFESEIALIIFELVQNVTYSGIYDILKIYIEKVIAPLKKENKKRFEIKIQIEGKIYSAVIDGESTEQQRNFVIKTLAQNIIDD